MSANLLVELFTEELPPKALRQLGEAFAHAISNWLGRAHLKDHTAAGMRIFSTPRRLAVLIPDVKAKSGDRPPDIKKLMPSKVAFDSAGKPTAALAKRLDKEGATAEQIECKLDGNAEYVFLNQKIPGITLQEGLQLALEEAVSKLPIPKVMSYQLADGATTVHFVRPAHGLVALHGGEVVPVEVLGLKAGRISHGHRFQGVCDIEIAAADAYEEALRAHGGVIADFDERRRAIAAQLACCAQDCGASLGAAADIGPLLDEVTALVEQPTVYTGSFDAEFLAVPQECLVFSMRAHQKYFPLFDADGRLINRFLIVSNMRLDDPKNIIDGNQRVVRPRLADARFFFDTDRKTRLEARVPELAKIVYHHKLGSQLERVERVQLLAGGIARLLGADAVLAERAAWLAKADLATHMVGEFPELQGVMGRYYALNDGEPSAVADAVAQHYLPRYAGDALPEGPAALALSLADKLETLAGLFGIGQQPTGDKDPFALRRYALGILRILIEKDLPLSLRDLVNNAFAAFSRRLIGDAHSDLELFMHERLRGHLRDEGYTANEVEAVLSKGLPPQLNKVPLQLAAVRAFASLPEAQSLAAANKRVVNILRQAEVSGESYISADAAELQDAAERELFNAIKTASQKANMLFERGDYIGYLKSFAILKSPVDAFFDSVMVMADNTKLRQNRLALLNDLRQAMNRVADISKLAA